MEEDVAPLRENIILQLEIDLTNRASVVPHFIYQYI